MKRKLLLFALPICLLAFQTNLPAAKILWDPNTTYIIPNDGNVYYIDSSLTLTDDFFIKGHFIRDASGTLDTDVYTIYNDNTLTISLGTINVNKGKLINKFSNTINIYPPHPSFPSNLNAINSGTIYSYGKIQNEGDINLNFASALFNLSATLQNELDPGTYVNHSQGGAYGDITINSGGNLYNYHGTVDVTKGTLTIKPGGKFHNVRGNNPWPFTIETGGNFSDGDEINLDRDLDLDWTWTITNKATINGYGNEITFGPNGRISIAKDASLLLEDVILNDISGSKILCLDTNSTLSINNSIWTLDNDFTFTQGSIHVANDWIINSNNHTFNYQSAQNLTIAPDATLHLLLTTLNYNAATPNNIKLATPTGTIHIEDSTLLATQPCNLSDGTLLVSGLGTLFGTSKFDLHNLTDIKVNGALRRNGDVLI